MFFCLENVQGGAVFSFCLLLENHLWIMHLGHCKGIVAQKHRVTRYCFILNHVKFLHQLLPIGFNSQQ